MFQLRKIQLPGKLLYEGVNYLFGGKREEYFYFASMLALRSDNGYL